ncbi:uncharacterized protein LOC111704274 isoform X2 [Eurytemora carolleeae]|uniref:uncharacterized protein LOC111704274 isoform X2 n=1 Tax=Eurytemora carolleeae TaxID=1294199 RepID=UPI000C79198A|nr:uncharacterized protein LOC111704274 isoform X2 [Eurytemora carolleeae]|eukprot:XP_023332246.1 uncharacterized protein LOC111704274 isoform X2 [Eurytemora affinis]
MECLKRMPVSWQQFLQIALFDLTVKLDRRYHALPELYKYILKSWDIFQLPRTFNILSNQEKRDKIVATLTSFDVFNHTLEGLWGLTDLRPPPRGVFALKDNGFVSERTVLEDVLQFPDVESTQIICLPSNINPVTSQTPSSFSSAPSLSPPAPSTPPTPPITPGSTKNPKLYQKHVHPNKTVNLCIKSKKPTKASHQISRKQGRHTTARSGQLTRNSERGQPTRNSERAQPTRNSERAQPTKNSERGQPTRNLERGQPTRNSERSRRGKVPSNGTRERKSLKQSVLKRELHSPLLEKPLEVVRPLPFQIARELHEKGFPKVCVKFASIVPPRKEEIDAVILEKCPKRKYRKREKCEQGENKNEKDLISAKMRFKEQKSRWREERERLTEEKVWLQAGKESPKFSTNAGSVESNGLKADINGCVAESLVNGINPELKPGEDARLLDSLIPAKQFYGGRNNPFHLGCSERLRQARNILCNRKLQLEDLTRWRTRLKKRKHKFCIEESRKFWKEPEINSEIPTANVHAPKTKSLPSAKLNRKQYRGLRPLTGVPLTEETSQVESISVQTKPNGIVRPRRTERRSLKLRGRELAGRWRGSGGQIKYFFRTIQVQE